MRYRVRLGWRRLRLWLGRKILPAGVVTMDMGPMISAFQQVGKSLRDAELIYDTTPILEDEEAR